MGRDKAKADEAAASLVGLRAAYSFPPSMYLQSLVQYNDQTENFSSNIRFGWLNTAGTGLYIVYNEQQTLDMALQRATRGPVAGISEKAHCEKAAQALIRFAAAGLRAAG